MGDGQKRPDRKKIEKDRIEFPIDWVKLVNEQAVYLNKTVEAVKSGLMQERPTADGQVQPSNDWVSGAGVD